MQAVDREGCPTAKGSSGTGYWAWGRAGEGTVCRIIAGEQGRVPIRGYENKNLRGGEGVIFPQGHVNG